MSKHHTKFLFIRLIYLVGFSTELKVGSFILQARAAWIKSRTKFESKTRGSRLKNMFNRMLKENANIKYKIKPYNQLIKV